MSNDVPVRIELRTALPVAIRALPALEQLLYQAAQVHGVPTSEATMRQDGPDLVLSYELTVPEPEDPDDA